MWHTSAKWADFRGFLESICIICVIVTWLAGGKKGQLCSSVLGKKKKKKHPVNGRHDDSWCLWERDSSGDP